MMPTTDPDAAWNGIAALYADPAVASELLRRQDEEGLDVTLELFARWIALHGDALDASELRHADIAVAPWRAQVIAPLRDLRRRMKAMAGDDVRLQAVRSRVQAAELAAERAEVDLLCDWLRARRGG